MPMCDDDANSNRAPLPRWVAVGFVIVGLASVTGLVGLVLRALAMVRDGRGMETYRTFFLVQFNWIGLLALIGSAIAALLVAAVFRWRERQQWRALERKHSVQGKRD